MIYQECVDYLFGLHRFGIRLGLETMQGLCAGLGNPEQRLKFVHIAGTNGKGSTAAFLESVLREAGYRTGLYTSPHLIEMGERIRVCGETISKEDIVRLTLHIRAVIDSRPELKDTTFFEFVTAMALLYFGEKKVEIVVWETGLGGRLDATNVVDPECCIITGIGYDHMEHLGDTLEKIASEKAGIIKKGRPVVMKGYHPDSTSDIHAADKVLHARAAERGSEVVVVDTGRTLLMEKELPSGRFSFYDEGQKWILGLKGDYQCKNALLALKTCEVLQQRGWLISQEAKAKGLEQARWPGRFDILGTNPPWVLDGAHNEEGLKSVMASWYSWFGQAPGQVVFGCVTDKNLDAMAMELFHTETTVRLVGLSTQRSQSLDKMKSAFLNKQTLAYDSLSLALQDCRTSGQSTLIVGSLYLAGEVLALLKDNPHELKLNG